MSCLSNLGCFGQAGDGGCTTIAIGPKREHISGDPGTFRREWRICCRPGKVRLESRRADFDASGNEVEGPYGNKWDLSGEGGNESEAMADYGDSMYETASTMHPIHAEHRRHFEEQKTAYEERSKAEQALKDGGPVGALRRQFTGRFEAELKRAKLYGKAKQGTAPQDKVDAIRTRVMAEYKKAEPEAMAEDVHLRKVVHDAKWFAARRFRASARVCR